MGCFDVFGATSFELKKSLLKCNQDQELSYSETVSVLNNKCCIICIWRERIGGMDESLLFAEIHAFLTNCSFFCSVEFL